MSLIWLVPAAWLGLALLVLPILIHLLARQRSHRVPFPTLRFLPTSQLAALSRRAVTDPLLLLVRMGVIVLAVAAAAAPVFVSAARRESWNARVARAIVLSGGDASVSAAADDEARESFVSARFAQQRLSDAVRAASAWLTMQPPARRELVVVGDIRERTIAPADFEVLGPHVGIRFLPVVSSDAPSPLELDAVSDVGGEITARRLQVLPELTRTTARYVPHDRDVTPAVRVIAARDQQEYGDALVRAVLRQGVVADSAVERAVTILFDGAPAEDFGRTTPATAWMREALQQNPDVRRVDAVDFVVRAAMPVTDTRAANIVASVVRSVFAADLERLEPRRVAPAILARWSRPAGAVPPEVLPADEGDRRWLWGGALVLLGVEQLLRTRRRRA